MPSEIPGPSGIPILGNIFDIDPNQTWNSLNKLAREYGPIFKVTILGHPLVFISSVALLEEICDQTRFRKLVAGPVKEIRYAVNDSLFTAYDKEPSWGIAHRIMMPHLTQSATDSLFGDMAEVIPDLTNKWSKSPKQRTLITKDLDRLLLASCKQCFFNQRVHVLEGAEPPMINAMEAATMEAMKRPTRPPPLNWLYQRRFAKDTKIMRDFSAEVIKIRKTQPETVRKDILDAMINNKDPETGEKLADSQIIDEIISCFIGAATAPNLIAYALYYLMENPSAVEKAHEELDRVVGDGKITLDHLKELHWVEAILRESIRLSAPAPGFNIEPIPNPGDESPILLAGGEYEVPHNQPMLAVLGQVNRDPAVFEDPEAFKPERVLGEKWDQLPAAAKKGFGNGKRECIGKIWAWRWSFFTLASILKDTKFELADPNYKLESNGAFSVKPLNFYGLVSPRK
ncbi:hypothetical protein N7541_008307 [Penicillium brevicompactum]|uniref:Self-sufficient cytochrome P450 monooxygenase CYP505E4 n=1 Tax=Penicillium brevicompactum TaxID=5074 RepID=A0A9W9R0A0_PENBR|nr:hypothetical protein N7541_008307 [Penicillium brevicompactum]